MPYSHNVLWEWNFTILWKTLWSSSSLSCLEVATNPVLKLIIMRLIRDMIKTFADGIGIDLKLLWDKFKDQPSPLVDKLRSKGLLIYSWTIQDDNKRKMEWMNAKNSNELYFKLVRVLRLDGIITEYWLYINDQVSWKGDQYSTNVERVGRVLGRKGH